MSIKISLNYSQNFSLPKRKKNQIKFIIFHYTGMKIESDSINRLTKIQSEVSAHYFIKKNGEIVSLVPDRYVAWHAGISSWKKFKLLNKNSIGIEISNPGHKFEYKNFSKKQINSVIKLAKFLVYKYKIKKNYILGHSDIAPDRKLDPGEKFPWKKLSEKNIGLWHNLSKKILTKLRNKECDKLRQIIFMKNLSKIGYPRLIDSKAKKQKFYIYLVKAFQRRFRQELINGKIDQECLLISNKLVKLKF